MEKTTILIADDHTLVREAWSLIFNSDERYKVIAESGSGEDAVEKAKKLRPKVVIMDINMPGLSGIDATQQIRKYAPGTKVLGVSLHTQPVYVRKMIRKGAMGYVTKNSSREEMFKAISEINNDRKYICEEIRNIMSECDTADATSKAFYSLSKREIDIILFLKKGYSSKEIADELDIAVKTVEAHRYNILRKLQLKNTAALVNYISNSELNMDN